MNAAINLVPTAEQTRQARKRRQRAWFNVHACIVAITLACATERWLTRQFGVEIDRPARAALEAQAAELTRRCITLQTERERIAALADRAVEREHDPLPEELARVVRAAPDSVRLAELSLTRPGDGRPARITVRGQALDYRALQDFVDAVQATGAGGVEIRETAETQLLGARAIAFLIEVALAGGAP